MRISPTNDVQILSLLNSSDSSQTWGSCDERRHCILCEQNFRGRQVRMSWVGSGQARLHCPTKGCSGGPQTWVRLGNPLVAGEAWDDWDRIIRDTEKAAS
jgi:hypothetical protein